MFFFYPIFMQFEGWMGFSFFSLPFYFHFFPFLKIQVIKHAHLVTHFHLDAAGPFLYLFYGESEAGKYDSDTGEWEKLPRVDFSVVYTPMCMIESNADEIRKFILKKTKMIG